MNTSDEIRDRARCIRARAQYPHELALCDGLERGADLLDTGGVERLISAISKESNLGVRQGLRKSLALVESDVRGSELLDSLIMRLDAVEVALRGLTMALKDSR